MNSFETAEMELVLLGFELNGVTVSTVEYSLGQFPLSKELNGGDDLRFFGSSHNCDIYSQALENLIN